MSNSHMDSVLKDRGYLVPVVLDSAAEKWPRWNAPRRREFPPKAGSIVHAGSRMRVGMLGLRLFRGHGFRHDQQ